MCTTSLQLRSRVFSLKAISILLFSLLLSTVVLVGSCLASDIQKCENDCLKKAKLFFEPADYVYDVQRVGTTVGDWVVKENFFPAKYCKNEKLLNKIGCGLSMAVCKKNGFYAALFHNTKNDFYVLAFRGTDSLIDGWEDIKNFLGFGGDLCVNTQYFIANEITNTILTDRKIDTSRLVVVGHSLGGGLASFAALRHGLQAYVYNTARSSWVTKELTSQNAKIHSYITYLEPDYHVDIVSSLGSPTSKTTDYYIETPISRLPDKYGKGRVERAKDLITGLIAGGFTDEMLKKTFSQLTDSQIWYGIKLHSRANFRAAFYGDCANTIDGIKKPIATAIVFDHSGSMNEEQKNDVAIKAAVSYVQEMEEVDQLSVSTFSDRAESPENLHMQLKSSIGPSVVSVLMATKPSGKTNIGAGLESGLGQLCSVSSEKYKKGALLLSDGMNNVGEYDSTVEKYRRMDIPIFTIKYGKKASEKDLRDIAEKTNGSYWPANQVTLNHVYTKIKDDIYGNTGILASHDWMGPDTRLAYDFDVSPGADTLNVKTTWQGSRLKTLLRSPGGVAYSDEALPSDQDRFEESSISQYFQITVPEPGKWRVELSWDVPPEVPERVNLNVSEHTDVYTNIHGFKPEYKKGEVVEITVNAMELDSGNNKFPLQDVRVRVTIQIPGEEIIRIISAQGAHLQVYEDLVKKNSRVEELFDDGNHNDYGIKDGIFGGAFSETMLEGSYIVTAEIAGNKSDGTRVNRKSVSSFQVGNIASNRVTTSQIAQHGTNNGKSSTPRVISPLGNMNSGSQRESNSGGGGRSRSLMDSISN